MKNKIIGLTLVGALATILYICSPGSETSQLDKSLALKNQYGLIY